MPSLWNFIRGYVIINVQGGFLERFINMCSKLDVDLWKVKRTSEITFSALMKLPDVRKIRKVARRTCCKVHFAKRKGLPFVIKRLVGHKMFLVGVVVCLLVVVALNMFIWQVNIICDQPFDHTKLESVLYKNGIRAGATISSLDLEQGKLSIVKECSNISYLYLRRNGMVVDVHVALGKSTPTVLSGNVPCDIVAKKTGVVSHIYSKIGDKVVEVGSLVTKGQLLVSGQLMSKIETDPPKMVHAIGIVKANTWYEGTERVLSTKTGEYKAVAYAANIIKARLEKNIDTTSIIKRTELVVFQNKKGEKFAKVTIFCEENIGLERGMG